MVSAKLGLEDEARKEATRHGIAMVISKLNSVNQVGKVGKGNQILEAQMNPFR